jgi:hypothetical protein
MSDSKQQFIHSQLFNIITCSSADSGADHHSMLIQEQWFLRLFCIILNVLSSDALSMKHTLFNYHFLKKKMRN